MANLWVDGRRLAMTSFKVQHAAGSGWVSAVKYEMNHKYRFRACFHNLFGRSNMLMCNRDCELNDIYMTGFQVRLKLPFAKFSNASDDKIGCYTLTKVRESSDQYVLYDFNDTIKPSSLRWFEFGDFTWMGPPTPVASAPVEIQVFHLEVYHAGFPDAGRVIPNAA